jgi:hypothetical protein
MPLYYDNIEHTMDVTFITEHKYLFDHVNAFVTINPFIQDKDTIKKINEEMDIVIYPQISHPHNFKSTQTHFQRIGINKPWIQLSWDTNLPKTENYLIFNYWATNINDSMYETWDRTAYQSSATNKRQFLYSCLNHIAKEHRLGILIRLFYSDYYCKCLASITKTTRIGDGIPASAEYVARDINNFSSKYNDQQILNFYSTLPWVCKNEENFRISFWQHDAYVNSYVNIVTEHDFESKFLSEKSIKPFLTEQIAIFVAGPSTVQLLRELGIDTFDDVIDHNYYDTELDPSIRIDKIHELLNKMSTWNWEEIYAQTEHRRKANRHYLLSGKLLTEFKQKLVESMNLLIYPQ